MALFNKTLINNNQKRHDGRALWKYNLSESDFQQLRKVLLETKRLEAIDPRDVTLYYAEWWKRCYNGGFPSKKDVYDSLQNDQYFNEESFYQVAKKGANLLGIRWIKNQNTLYFKTLLLQGGIPIRHITNNKGAYKNLLTKLMEINPKTIDEFAFDPTVTSLLPASSRSDEIYECCLSIFNAIVGDDQEYLSIFENNSELEDITRELKIKRHSLKDSISKPRFRSFWVFEPQKSSMRLYLGIPDLQSEAFGALFFEDPEAHLEIEYKMYVNSNLLCKFIKRGDNTFKVHWIDDEDLNWDGTNRLPDLYLVSNTGEKCKCQHLVNQLPDLTKPTLWSQYSDQQWILERGFHTSAIEGFILSPKKSITEEITQADQVYVGENSFHWIRFEETITIDNYSFITKSSKIDWIIADQQPAWIKRSNFTVVRGRPKVVVYDEDGNPIQKVQLKWRLKNTTIWNEWSTLFAVGILEIQIRSEHVIEYDYVYNIGALDLQAISSTFDSAEIKLINSNFNIVVNEGPLLYASSIGPNRFELQLKNNKIIPTAISVTLKTIGQSSGLRFEMKPPFRGVEIIDDQGNILPENSYLCLGSLRGLRLISNQDGLFANIWNTTRSKLVISTALTDSFISVRTFEDSINQLFALSDAMDGNAEIIIEIVEKKGIVQTKLKEYRLKRYQQIIEWGFYFGSHLTISTQPVSPDLYAVPLDCSNEQLQLRYLIHKHGQYKFPEGEVLKKFIVFSNNKNTSIQPVFISPDPGNIATEAEDRQKRIVGFKNKLLKASADDDDWKKLLSYYQICDKNDIPYSTFDILKSISYSSLLAAKAFIYLACWDSEQHFTENAYLNIERDLGISFHWINKDHWNEAMDWMGCFEDDQLLQAVSEAVLSHFESCQPNLHFNKLSAYITQQKLPELSSGYHLNGRINDLRSSFGERVLKELPRRYPQIPEQYQQVIPVNDSNSSVEILLRSPLIAALSITGLSDNLWAEDNEFKRRNIKYSQQLDPDWYAEALNYSVTKLTILS